ncbi:MAG: GDCCVxC domain-containing (seleno)protein [Dongiaceae bacterium]
MPKPRSRIWPRRLAWPATRQHPRNDRMIELRSTITCPECGHRATETMPTDFCQYFYDCKRCGAQMKPKTGHCCVFCSFGSVPCPPVQQEREGERASDLCCGSGSHG